MKEVWHDNCTIIDIINNQKPDKMKIAVTSVTQTASEILGTKEKKLYYLIVENDKGGKLVINVGEKTHNEVEKLVAAEGLEGKVDAANKVGKL